MEGEVSLGIGNRTDHRQARVLIEEGIAYNQSRAAPALLMPSLGIKI